MKTLVKAISEEEFLEGIKKVDRMKIRLAFMLGFYQSMRISEIVGLRKQITRCCKADVIKKSKGRRKTYFCSKCNQERKRDELRRSTTVWQIEPLTSSQIDLEKGFIHIKNAKGGKDRDIPIMKPVRAGLKYLPIGIQTRQLEKLTKDYWSDIHFHCLRHSGATMYLNKKKVDIANIQKLLGHTNIATTQRYTHVNPENLKDTFDGVF